MEKLVEKLRIAVFASGGGSNFQALLDAQEKGKLDVEIRLCISNSPKAGALQRAEKHGIPTRILNPKAFATEAVYTETLLNILAEHDINFVVLAGYLRKIPTEVVTTFTHRMLNIHPSLLPSFGGQGMYGERVHQAVLAHGVRWTGVTVHLVDAEYDTGAIVLQEPVPVRFDDTPHSLAERVLKMEHRIYPEALQLFAEDKVRIEGRRAIIQGKLPRGRKHA